MYTMTPFEKKHFDLLNAFHDFENDFFAGTQACSSKEIIFKIVMEAELPGFEKDEIHLDVEDDCLKLSAEHHADSEDKDEQKHYIRKERSDISYQRSFDLTGIDAEKLDAEYKNIHFAGTQTRSRKKIIFKIVKCIQQIKMFLFKRCHGIHKNSSLSIVINHAICYLTSSRLLVGVSGCCFGRVTYRMPFLYSASSFSASMPVKSKLLW